MFLTGPYSGFPVPCASRTAVVTKSPHTSALKSKHANASTLAYSNVGGFFAPELKFAGYNGLVITGKASSPVYLAVNGDKVELRDAKKFWGKGTDEVDKLLPKELGDHRFQSLYIGPAGEKQVRYACIMHTASRAAGRSGTGCVMGSKMLKGVCVRGKGAPMASDREAFMKAYEQSMKAIMSNPEYPGRARYGTAAGITANSERGAESVRNYREGTMEGVEAIGGVLGGQIVRVSNWHTIFWMLTGVGALMLVSLLWLPETLPAERRVPASINSAFVNYRYLLQHKTFMRFTLCVTFYYVAAYAFIAGSPRVYISYFGVDPQHYGWLFLIVLGKTSKYS